MFYKNKLSLFPLKIDGMFLNKILKNKTIGFYLVIPFPNGFDNPKQKDFSIN